MHHKQPATYIMASQRNGTLYIGVTSNLVQRVYQHKQHLVASFTKKYNCILLVYYKLAETMDAAIAYEKTLKGWKRERKLALIEEYNPAWRDLWEEIAV